MKNISRKITFVLFLILFTQASLFSAEKKSTFQLGKEVAELKFELFKIENKLGEYEDMSDFRLYFIEAKKEHLLRKRNKELLEKVDNDKAAAKQIVEKATNEIISKAKELKDKSIDFLEYILDYFED